ncbi:tubby C-terminal-like domain-containing protein [Aspergillus recurvatus]
MDMDSLTPCKQPIAIRPEHIAPSTTTIRVNQHSASLSRGKFTISSIPRTPAEEPTTLFAVDGNIASWTQRRQFRDASGLPLFEIARKKLGVTWYLHLPEGTRNSHGSSGSADEPIATFVPQYSVFKDKFDVHFRNAAPGARDEEVVLAVRGQNIWKTRSHVYLRGKLVMVAKLTGTGKVAVYVPGIRPSWEVTVAEGMDLSLASVISVLLAQVLYQSSGKGKEPARAPAGDDDPGPGSGPAEDKIAT